MNNIYEIKKLYALIIYCDNYLENHYRLRVFNTLNQAKNFCKKTIEIIIRIFTTQNRVKGFIRHGVYGLAGFKNAAGYGRVGL